MMDEDGFAARYVRPNPGKALVVGSKVYEGRTDRRERYSDAVGADIEPGPGVDVVVDLEGPLPKGLGPFAHVDCISVLEHSRRPWRLAANIERLMVSGATLYLQVPFVWGLHDYGGDFFRFTVDGVRSLFPCIEWSALMYSNEKLSLCRKTPRVRIRGHIYIARTEVFGWGTKERS